MMMRKGYQAKRGRSQHREPAALPGKLEILLPCRVVKALLFCCRAFGSCNLLCPCVTNLHETAGHVCKMQRVLSDWTPRVRRQTAMQRRKRHSIVYC